MHSKAPKEWWYCPDSGYNAAGVPADCCLKGLAGTDQCLWHTDGKRPGKSAPVAPEAKFVAWDLEISKEIPEGTKDIAPLRPLGISCAAALSSDGDLRVWKPDLVPDENDDTGARYDDQMTPEQVEDMANYLIHMAIEGFPLVTWNGLGFDLDVLQEECEDHVTRMAIARMAFQDHIDPGYIQRRQMGYMIGLDTCAQALGLPGKTEGMSGKMAPVMWAKTYADQERVLEYVAQDARTTADVYRGLLAADKGVRWITKRGTLSKYPFIPARKDARLVTCAEAMKIRPADTSWMTSPPRPLKSYTDWAHELLLDS